MRESSFATTCLTDVSGYLIWWKFGHKYVYVYFCCSCCLLMLIHRRGFSHFEFNSAKQF